MKFRIFINIILIAGVFSGCSLKQMTTRTVGSISWEGSEILEGESDVEIARESTLPLVKSLEVFSAGDPGDRQYLALLAKSYAQYAFGFYEEDMLRFRGRDDGKFADARRRADEFYERGKTYGLRALGTKGAMKQALTGALPSLEKALRGSTKKDLPVLFWSAFAWGNWLNLHRDDPTAFVDTPRVQAIAERVVALDPGYAHGAALSFLGALHASRPPMLGGNPAKAKEYFDRAVEMAPAYLMNKVMAAQYLAVQMNDSGMFRRLLSEVMAADAAALPEQRLANELAKRRAALLMERIDEYF